MRAKIASGSIVVELNDCSASDVTEVLKALPAEVAPTFVPWPSLPVAPTYPGQVSPYPGQRTYRTVTGDTTAS